MTTFIQYFRDWKIVHVVTGVDGEEDINDKLSIDENFFTFRCSFFSDTFLSF